MARIESGSALHVFAAKYRKDLRPCLVLLTLGNKSIFMPFKLYFVSFTLSRFTMGVGAFSWKQLFIVINMSWIRRPSSVLCKPICYHAILLSSAILIRHTKIVSCMGIKDINTIYSVYQGDNITF